MCSVRFDIVDVHVFLRRMRTTHVRHCIFEHHFTSVHQYLRISNISPVSSILQKRVEWLEAKVSFKNVRDWRGEIDKHVVDDVIKFHTECHASAPAVLRPS